MNIKMSCNQMSNLPLTKVEILASEFTKKSFPGFPEGMVGSMLGFLFQDGEGVMESMGYNDTTDMNSLLLENESLEAFEEDGFDIRGKMFFAIDNMVVLLSDASPDQAMLKYVAKTLNVGVISYVSRDEKYFLGTLKNQAERLKELGFEDFGDTGILVFDPQKIDYQEIRKGN